MKALDLISLIGTDKFREAISPLVMPKPWRHKVKQYACMEKGGSDTCKKCAETIFAKTYYTQIGNCSIPDTYSGSLGDLAFTLMGKTDAINLKKATEEIGIDKFNPWPGKPEIWICAALRAIEISKENS
jgi:hypothetical protein